jgi:hypothetical protein
MPVAVRDNIINLKKLCPAPPKTFFLTTRHYTDILFLTADPVSNLKGEK